MKRFGPKLVLTTACAVVFSALPANAQPGGLDPTFGAGGVVLTSVGSGDASLSAVAVQPDGRIIVAGYALGEDDDDFVVARYLSTGALDPSFGDDGVTLTDFGPLSRANALTLQPDGEIVVAGFAGNDVAVARYRADGVLDDTFGTQGKTTIGFGGPGSAEAVTEDSGGRIVVAGWVTTRRQGDMALARLNTDGSLDKTFHKTGRVTLNMGSNEYASAVAVQSNGSITLAGAAGDDGTQFALARYGRKGTLDKTFGEGTGTVVTNFAFPASWANAVLVQPDGRICAAGFAYDGAHYRITMARYVSSGGLDPSFGGNGKVVTNLGPGDDAAQAVLLQPDGSLLVAGSHGEDFALARYTTIGSLDPTFGAGGYVTTDLGSTDQATAAALQADGRVLLAGYSGDDVRLSFALARYEGS